MVFDQDYGYNVNDMMIGSDRIKWIDNFTSLGVGLKMGKLV